MILVLRLRSSVAYPQGYNKKRERQAHRQTADRQRRKYIQRKKEREKETDSQRQKQTGTEKDRQTETHTQIIVNITSPIYSVP